MNAAVRRYFKQESVVGILTPRGVTTAGVPGVSGASGVSDDFSKRPPTGPVELAPWARAGVERPLRLASSIATGGCFAWPTVCGIYVQPVPANPTVFISGNVDVFAGLRSAREDGLGWRHRRSAAVRQPPIRPIAAEQRLGDELGADLNLGFQSARTA